MNFYELLKIVDQSIPGMEEQLGRPLTDVEKVDLVRGAITKWNEANPNNWIIIPAEWNKK